MRHHVRAEDERAEHFALLEVVRDHHEAAEARLRRVGGDGVGEVARAGAADRVEAELDRLGDRDGDDALLVRVRRVVARVVLDLQLVQPSSSPSRSARFSGVKPEWNPTRGSPSIGKQVAIPPQALRPARDRLARDLAAHRRVVVLDLVRPEALLADVHRRRPGLGARTPCTSIR